MSPGFLPTAVWSGNANVALTGANSASVRVDATTGIMTLLVSGSPSASVWADFEYPLATP